MDVLSPNLRLALCGTFVLAAIYFVYFELTTGARRRAIVKQYGCLPPKKFPCKDPILALDNFRDFIAAFRDKRGLALVYKRFHEQQSWTLANNSLGKTIISTVEPENLKHIQSLDFKNWSLGTFRKRDFLPLFGPGIFTTDYQQWQHSREMLRPNFVRNQVRDLQTFERHIAHLIAAIPRDGSEVDLSPLFFRLTMDSATDFLYGESTNTLVPGLSTVSGVHFAKSFDRALIAVSFRGRYGSFAFLAPQQNLREDTEFVHNYIDAIVDKAMAKRPQILAEKSDSDARYIFLDELIRQTDDKYQIRSELLNILLAGRDTTASLLTNLWFMLSKRSDIWAKVREEVDPLNGVPPTFDQIKEMKYLRAFINESLRLHPLVPLNGREADADTYLPRGGGPDGKSCILIKKGQQVSWSVYAMHRRQDLFGPDAEDFKPERWLGPKGLRPGWEYLPFNGGPRICLGQQFALTEASYTTIRMMQEYKAIESRDAGPWVEGLALTCVNANGAKVSLTPFSAA